MRPISKSYTSTGAKEWIPLDHYQTPFSVSYHVDVGTATYTVEATLDDVQDADVTPVAYTITSSTSSDTVAALTAPVRAIRVNIAAYTSGGVAFKIIQAGK